MRQLLTVILLIALFVAPQTLKAGGTDINMVVAFDRSESIDSDERSDQINGLIYALNDPAVLQAIQSGYVGRIGLTVLTWSSFQKTDVILPWTLIGTRKDAEAATAAILAVEGGKERIVHGRQTDFGLGLSTAMELLEEAPWFGRKEVINVISDGISNIGRIAIVDRDRAVYRGITINGLTQARGVAIEVLERYFRENVIGGPSAFVMSAHQPEDFALAMQRKMELEIALLNGLAHKQ